MVPLSPIRLISSANAFLGLGEEPVSGAPGRMVDHFLAQVGLLPGRAWDVAFVQHVGYWSHFENDANRSVWPLPRTGVAEDLASFARERKIEHDEPEPGDIALIAGARRGSIARVGIVVLCHGAEPSIDGSMVTRCTTIEGNVGRAGQPRGSTVMRVERELSSGRGDRFVRWADLDPRQLHGRADAGLSISLGRLTVRRAA